VVGAHVKQQRVPGEGPLKTKDEMIIGLITEKLELQMSLEGRKTFKNEQGRLPRQGRRHEQRVENGKTYN
jgi:hypothetical protein